MSCYLPEKREGGDVVSREIKVKISYPSVIRANGSIEIILFIADLNAGLVYYNYVRQGTVLREQNVFYYASELLHPFPYCNVRNCHFA